MIKRRSKAILASAIISTLYLIYVVGYFFDINLSSDDASEAIGTGIATALVLPHIFVLLVGVLLNWIGYATKINGFNLASAILYCVAAFLFLLYAVFLLPSIILCFVGFTKQKKLNGVTTPPVVVVTGPVAS